MKRIPAQAGANVSAVLTDLREVIGRGLFVHAPEDKRCKWCDYELACGGDRTVRQVPGKLGDPSLAPFVRLQTHE